MPETLNEFKETPLTRYRSIFFRPDTRHSVEVMRFHKEVKDLLSFAEENVNFDLAQMKIFYEAVKSANVDKLKTVVAEAMESAVNLLDDDYQLFRRHLLRERNLLKSR